MAKPEVNIFAPPALVVGARATLDIDVTVERETKVEFIEAKLEERQGWSVGSGKHRVSHRVTIVRHHAQLMGHGVLPAATTTRFSLVIELPDGTPPVHAVDPAYVELILRIHISLPWRIDGRYHYRFPVRLRPPARVERTPMVARSTDTRAPADAPRIELSLASTRLIAGEVCVGSVALFHLDDRKPREVEMSLVPMLDLYGRGRIRERRGKPYVFTVTVPAGGAGAAVPFSFQLPLLVPSFTGVSHRLAWWLVATSGSLFGKKVDIAVPLDIVDAAAAASTPRLVAAPRLGDQRIAGVLANAAAARQGWQGADLAPDDEGEFAIERAGMRIAYAYRDDGTFLLARIEQSPPLGLGLAVAPSSTLRHVFWQDIEVDIAAWDRAHHVGARSAEQAIPFLQAVVPAMMKCGRLGSLVRWDDGALAFERPMSAIVEHEVTAMVAELETLHAAIERARAGTPVPPGLAVDRDAWRALADKLDGEVSFGDLSITGALDQLPVALGLEFDDARPARIRIALGDAHAASEQLRRVTFTLRRPASDVLGEPAAEALVDAVTRWPADVIDLELRDGVASVGLVLDGIADATRVRELVEALRGVLIALSPATGPYR